MVAVLPLLAALAGLAFAGVARLPPVWAFMTVLGLLTPCVAILSGSWTRFFVAFMIFGFSLNLDKTFNHSDYILAGVGGLAVSLVDIALAGLLVAAVMKAVATRALRLRLYWSTTVPALVLMAIMMLSIAVSSEVSLSFYQLLEMGKLLVLYLFVANIVQSEEDVQFMLRILLTGVIFQGSVVFLQYLNLFPEGVQTSLGFKGGMISKSGSTTVELFRPSGTIGHANILGGFMAITLPVALSQLLLQSGMRGKLLPLAALGIGTLALVLSFSRGAWISFAVAATLVLSVAFVTGQLRGKNLLWVALGFVLVSLVAVAFSSLLESRIFDPDPGSAHDRMLLNELALSIIRDKPLLGVGLNTFGKVMENYDTYHFAPGNVVHNVYLLLAAENGIFAPLAFLWFILAVIRQGVRGMRLPSPYMAMTATAILGGLGGLWLQMLLEILVTGPPIQVFWFFTGLLVAMNRLQQPDVAVTSR
jgi:putative inorganic carbon (HCO3(-)) transporter